MFRHLGQVDLFAGYRRRFLLPDIRYHCLFCLCWDHIYVKITAGLFKPRFFVLVLKIRSASLLGVEMCFSFRLSQNLIIRVLYNPSMLKCTDKSGID